MRKVMVFLVAALILSLPAMLKAENAPAKSLKIGYVNLQKALNDVEEGKKAKDALKREFDEKQRKLDGLQSQLQNMKTDLDKQRLILSADALKAKEEEYKKKFFELQNMIGEFKNELSTKQAQLTEGILLVLSGLVRDAAKKNSYDLVLEKSQDVVLYSTDGNDLTEEVIKSFNAMPAGQRQSMMKTEGEAMKLKKGISQ